MTNIYALTITSSGIEGDLFEASYRAIQPVGNEELAMTGTTTGERYEAKKYSRETLSVARYSRCCGVLGDILHRETRDTRIGIPFASWFLTPLVKHSIKKKNDILARFSTWNEHIEDNQRLILRRIKALYHV